MRKCGIYYFKLRKWPQWTPGDYYTQFTVAIQEKTITLVLNINYFVVTNFEFMSPRTPPKVIPEWRFSNI